MAGRRRFRTWAERVALGAIMSAVAFVVERRLIKLLKRRGEATPAEAHPGGRAELSTAPEDVAE